MKKTFFLLLISLILSGCMSLDSPPDNTVYNQLPENYESIAREAYFKHIKKRYDETVFGYKTNIEILKLRTKFNFGTPFKGYTNDAGMNGGAVNWTGWVMLAEVLISNKSDIVAFKYTDNGVIVDTNNPEVFIKRFFEM